jgi:hypothetical protein
MPRVSITITAEVRDGLMRLVGQRLMSGEKASVSKEIVRCIIKVLVEEKILRGEDYGNSSVS